MIKNQAFFFNVKDFIFLKYICKMYILVDIYQNGKKQNLYGNKDNL